MKNEQEKITTEKSNAALREEMILEFWREHNIFQKSLEKDSPKGNYVFYDGPPFATGQMHYGHILGSTAKDAIGRYQTMRGFHVPRRWGWDCHGLPIENIVEKELGIAGHKEIEALGIDKFVEYARSKVLEYDKDWEKGIERIGRWVNFRGGYKTMDNTFIESVWWALSELNKKGLIYEGVRVLAYCPRCETPIANSEIAMDNSYKDITDISVYVKFALVDEPNTYFLAWTTTPWTLPGNFALAANPKFNYAKIKIGDSFYILAKERLIAIKEEYEVVEENLNIIGKAYKPLFDYFVDHELAYKENAWKVYAGDHVTADAGTGIVHTAPGYGEEDMELAKRENIPFAHHVLNDGTFANAVRDFMGLPVKPKSSEKDGHQVTDIEIIKHLAHQGFLFAKEKIVHSYPHCMRCDTPIIYYALPSWFVNIQKVKKDILKEAKSMSWVPAHLKEGRFKNNVESAPDWTISRNRYWASPLPVWKSKSGKMMFVSGLEDLKSKVKKSGNSYFVMRHGETAGNLQGLIMDDATEETELTAGGVALVKEAAIKTKKIGPEVIIFSPLGRTRKTAELVAAELGIDQSAIVVDDRLTEMRLGPSFNGKKWDDYHNLYPKTADQFSKAPEGGESYRDVRRRMLSVIFELEEKYKDKKILIVTHGGPAWLLFTGATGLGIEETLAEIRNKEGFHYFQNAEMRAVPFVPFPHNADYELDLHRPYIDAITLLDEAGEEYARIPEVVDCWFESGSMPFAQDHYPFVKSNFEPHGGLFKKKSGFPAGFVAEYIAQTRTWFYYTHAVSTILFGAAPFEHIVTTGTLRAEDGQKISKSKKNYPDPWIFIDKYGVDPLRMYLMSGPLMKGEDANFSEKIVADIANKMIGRLYNVLSFYDLYRDKSLESEASNIDTSNVLDLWIFARLNQLTLEVTQGMESYDMAEATRPFDLFVDDLSTWYLRRSRDRIKNGDADAKKTLYIVLKTVSQLLAPFAPFTAEDIWQKLKTRRASTDGARHDSAESDAESVHLSVWPEGEKVDKEVIEKMQKVREVVTLGLEARQKAKIPVRQPLASLKIKVESEKLSSEYLELIKDELNVKEVVLEASSQKLDASVVLDTEMTAELKLEGDYRELVRKIQDVRKEKGLTPSDTIDLLLPNSYKEIVASFEENLKKTVLAKTVAFADIETIAIQK